MRRSPTVMPFPPDAHALLPAFVRVTSCAWRYDSSTPADPADSKVATALIGSQSTSRLVSRLDRDVPPARMPRIVFELRNLIGRKADLHRSFRRVGLGGQSL